MPRRESRKAIAALAAALVALSLLTACPKPLALPTAGTTSQAQATATLEGVVDFGDRRVQANLNTDVAVGATVSLIELSSGNTVSSVLTDAKGRFVLRFSNEFRPVSGTTYYIEAIKGLPSGESGFNAAGGEVVRARTIALYDNGWRTLTSNIAGATLAINGTTTALSALVSLRKGSAQEIDPKTILGSIIPNMGEGGYPDAFTSPDPARVSVTLVQRAYDLVMDSYAKNRDPIRWMTLPSGEPDNVKLLDLPFSVLFLSPESQVVNETLELVGSNFAPTIADNKVFFQADGGGTIEGAVTKLTPDLSRLTVRVPAGTVNGPIQLQVSGKTLSGPVFRLATRDGHSVVDANGNVYVVNASMGTVSVVERLPGSERTGVRAVVSGLDNPKALTFGAAGYNTLYVATGGATRQVHVLNLLATPPTVSAYSASGGVANPSGMAFAPAGALYLSDSTANQLYVVTGAGASAQAVSVTGSALSSPRGICFGPDGKLYVANYGAGNILAVTLTGAATGTATEVASGLSGPWGIAFDNRGNLYVSNNAGNSIYRMLLTSTPGVTPLTFGPISAFASLPTPAGMDADPSGYLYVADNKSNGIYRVNPQAESRQIGFGISYPTSIWADGDGKFILTDTGRLLKLDSNQLLSVYAEGLATAKGLVRDSQGNFYTNQSGIGAITMIRSDGSTAQVLSGMGASAQAELQIRADKLYVRANVSNLPGGGTASYQGEVRVYDLANLGAGPSRLQSVMRRSSAIARDESGGTYHGYYYVLGKDEASIWRVQRISGSQATTTLVLKDPARLKDAQDIHVDGSGRIWVADYQGPSGNGSLIRYAADGSVQAEYETVNKPTNFASDANRDDLWVNSHVTAGDLRKIDVATGLVSRTIGGFNLPRSFAFTSDRTTLYVNEWGLDRISKLANYQGADTPIQSFYGNGDSADIETGSGGVFATSGNVVRFIENDGVTVNPTYRAYYHNIVKTFKNSDGKLALVTDPGWLEHEDDGSWTAFTGSLTDGFGRGDYGAPRGSGLVTGTEFFSYGRHGAWTGVMEQALDGSVMRTAYLGTDLGGMTSNGSDTAYFTRIAYGAVYKMTNGVLSTLAGDAYGAGDISYGIAYQAGKLYQTNRTLHRIDEIDATSGARSQLKVGLLAPEL